MVKDGTQLFTIVDPTTLRLEAQVPADYLRTLKVGTPVQFQLSGFGDQRLTGKVSRVVPAVAFETRPIYVLVLVAYTAKGLVAGLFAEGRVIDRKSVV